MSEAYTLRNRRSDGASSSQERQEVAKPTEEVLVKNSTVFMSIESRLDARAVFPAPEASDDDNYEFPEKSSTLRRNSSASAQFVKIIYTPNLVRFTNGFLDQSLRLKVIDNKPQNIYNTLDDPVHLFIQLSRLRTRLANNETTQLSQSKEILSRRGILTINTLTRNSQVVTVESGEKTPQATTDYHAPSFQHFRFYNFNKALQKGREKSICITIFHSGEENRYIIYGYRFSLNP